MFRNLFATEIKANSVQQWLLAAGILLGVTLVLHLLSSFVSKYLRDTAARTAVVWDDVVLAMARRTSWAFQIAMGVAVSRHFLALPDTWNRRLHAGVVVIAVVQCGVWATALVDYLLLAHLDRRSSGGESETAYQTGRNMLRFSVLIIVWVGVVLLTMENVGINVSTLVAGLGVTGVAVAFATQNLLGDLFASVSLLLDKPFLIGDFIITDTFMGTVERIGIRSTRMRSLSGEALIFANSDLAKSRLRNYKSLRERRVVFNFSLSYDTSVEQLAAVGGMVQKAIQAQKSTRFDRAHWLSFGDKGLLFECVYYVLSGDYNLYMDIQQAINLQILAELRRANIALAYGTVLTHGAQPEQGTR